MRARWAVTATAVHVLSMRATQPPSSASGQGCPTIHPVASFVALSSSSAAANMVTRLILIDAANRVSAVVTSQKRRRLDEPVPCGWSVSIVIVMHVGPESR